MKVELCGGSISCRARPRCHNDETILQGVHYFFSFNPLTKNPKHNKTAYKKQGEEVDLPPSVSSIPSNVKWFIKNLGLTFDFLRFEEDLWKKFSLQQSDSESFPGCFLQCLVIRKFYCKGCWEWLTTHPWNNIEESDGRDEWLIEKMARREEIFIKTIFHSRERWQPVESCWW